MSQMVGWIEVKTKMVIKKTVRNKYTKMTRKYL